MGLKADLTVSKETGALPNISKAGLLSKVVEAVLLSMSATKFDAGVSYLAEAEDRGFPCPGQGWPGECNGKDS